MENKHDDVNYLIRNIHNNAMCICELMNQLEYNITPDDATDQLITNLNQALAELIYLNRKVLKIEVKEI